ncbi:MAG: hypothetical protein ACJAQ4_000928 [Cryomorphaceae bacterium]
MKEQVRPFTLFILLLLWSVVPAWSQNQAKADDAFDAGNYIEAVEEYLKLVDKEPDNPYYNEQLGKSYLKTYIDPLLALDYLLVAENKGKFDKSLYIEIAIASTYHLDYDQALYYLNKFEEESGVKKKNLSKFKKLKDDCIAALDLLKYPVDVDFSRLSNTVNTVYPDYHPFVTKDGKTLYFTSRRKLKPGTKPEFDGYFPSDIFMSERSETGWAQAAPLSQPINTPYDEQVVGITDSGDSIFFYIDHVENFGDIYVSAKEVGRFSKPKNLGEQVNSRSVESACSLSKNGETMLFSSERDGGFGALDIYMVKRLPNREWGEPENLGGEINTPLNEDFPTLSGDGLTMYFSSDGHPGMGGYDLFFSTWDTQNMVWSKPQNLGYPLNSPFDNKTISYTQNGETAYVTRMDPGSNTQLDIHEVRFNKMQTEDPAIFLINILASANIEGAAPEILIKNDLDEVVGKYLPNKISGRYTLGLYPGKYFLYVDASGFSPYTEVLVVNNYHTKQETNVKLIKLTE